MDPAARATHLARTMSEAMNGLGMVLCGPAARRHVSDLRQLPERWERDYAPTLRGVHLGRGVALGPSVDRVSAAIRARPNLEVPEELAALRLAIREFMATVGVPLPGLSPDEAAVCELHGRCCPLQGDLAR